MTCLWSRGCFELFCSGVCLFVPFVDDVGKDQVWETLSLASSRFLRRDTTPTKCFGWQPWFSSWLKVISSFPSLGHRKKKKENKYLHFRKSLKKSLTCWDITAGDIYIWHSAFHTHIPLDVPFHRSRIFSHQMTGKFPTQVNHSFFLLGETSVKFWSMIYIFFFRIVLRFMSVVALYPGLYILFLETLAIMINW